MAGPDTTSESAAISRKADSPSSVPPPEARHRRGYVKVASKARLSTSRHHRILFEHQTPRRTTMIRDGTSRLSFRLVVTLLAAWMAAFSVVSAVHNHGALGAISKTAVLTQPG